MSLLSQNTKVSKPDSQSAPVTSAGASQTPDAADKVTKDGRADRRAALIAALNAGEIPVVLRDEMRLVPLESEAGRKFQAAMEQIARRFNPDWDPKTQPVRFALMDIPEMNACQVRAAEPPLIAFNVGCFIETRNERGKPVPPLKSVDEVALVLAHEQVHLAIERRYNPERNSKLEEGMASFCSVEATFRAGFDPRSSLEWHRTQLIGSSDWSWPEVLDEHPLPRNALSIHEAALTAVTRKYGAITAQATPLDSTHELCKAAALAKHESTLEKLLHARGYAGCGAAEKVQILIEVLRSEEFMSGRRLGDFCREIRKLASVVGPDRELRDALFAPLFDAVLELPNRGHATAAWRILAWVADSSEGYRPIGRLAPLAKAAQEFIEASDLQSAQRAAQELLRLADAEPLTKSDEGCALLARVAFPNFSYPDVDTVRRLRRKGANGVPLSWSSHTKLAREEYDRLGTSEITRAMLALGVDDERLFRIDHKVTVDLLTHRLTRVSEGPRQGSSRVRDIVISGGRAIEIEIEDREGRAGAIKGYGRGLTEGGYRHAGEARPLQYYPSKKIAQQARDILSSYATEQFERLGKIPDGPERSATMGELERISLWLSPLTEGASAMKVLLGLSVCDAAPENFVRLNQSELDNAVPQRVLLQRLRELLAEGKTEAVRRIVLALTARPISPPNVGTVGWSLESDQWRRHYGAQPDGRVGVFASQILGFALTEPHGLFSDEERMRIVARGVKWPELLDYGLRMQDSAAGGSKISPSGRGQFEGLLADIAPFYEALGHTFRAPRSWRELELQIEKLGLERHPLGQITVMAETTLLFSAAGTLPPPSTSQVVRILRMLQGGIPDVGREHNKYDNITALSALGTYIREQFAACIGSAPVWNSDPAKAIGEWQTLYREGLLSAAAQYKHLAGIVSKIGKVSSASERISLYETLITTADARIGAPELRSKVIARWAQAIKASYGVDDGSPEYCTRILEIVDRVKDKLEPRDRAIALNTLANEIVAQVELSRRIGECALATHAQLFQRTHGSLVVLEGGASLVTDSRERRFAVIEYLKNPLSRGSVARIVDLALESAVTDGDGLKRVALQRRVEGQLIDLHKNFWAAPIEARALIMKEILTPHVVSQKELMQKNGVEISPELARAKRAAEAFKYVLGWVFPDSSPHGAAARQWVEAYIKGMPDYMQHIALSALLVAGQKSAEQGKGTGFAIASFLESMGPAETKAGQAAQGHPKTPDEIRADLARLKTHAAEPFRWELFNLIDHAFKAQGQSPVVRVAHVLGSASLYVAVDVELQDGSRAVLSLLRPNALERAQFGFELQQRMIEGFEHDSDSFRVMRELIGDAKRLVEDETNTSLAKVQRDMARAVYNGITVTVDGEPVNFHVPAVTGAGAGYVLSERAPGEHFIDLPHDEHRKRLAKAIMTLELNTILSGRPFDNDRHGGNCRVQGDTVYHFDFGGMMLAPPSDDELRQLGSVVAKAGLGAQSVDEFVNRYFGALRDREALGEEVSPILKRAQKALLSLAEYSEGMSKEDLLEVLVSAAAHELHPAVQESVQQEVLAALVQSPELGAVASGLFLDPPIKIARGTST